MPARGPLPLNFRFVVKCIRYANKHEINAYSKLKKKKTQQQQYMIYEYKYTLINNYLEYKWL